jgi:hypothetical protein
MSIPCGGVSKWTHQDISIKSSLPPIVAQVPIPFHDQAVSDKAEAVSHTQDTRWNEGSLCWTTPGPGPFKNNDFSITIKPTAGILASLDGAKFDKAMNDAGQIAYVNNLLARGYEVSAEFALGRLLTPEEKINKSITGTSLARMRNELAVEKRIADDQKSSEMQAALYKTSGATKPSTNLNSVGPLKDGYLTDAKKGYRNFATLSEKPVDWNDDEDGLWDQNISIPIQKSTAASILNSIPSFSSLVPARYNHITPEEIENYSNNYGVGPLDKGLSYVYDNYVPSLRNNLPSVGTVSDKVQDWWTGKPKTLREKERREEQANHKIIMDQLDYEEELAEKYPHAYINLKEAQKRGALPAPEQGVIDILKSYPTNFGRLMIDSEYIIREEKNQKKAQKALKKLKEKENELPQIAAAGFGKIRKRRGRPRKS